jgi:hypothetical protein
LLGLLLLQEPDPDRPSLESAFHTIQSRMVRLLNYATAVAPAVKDKPDLLPELADSVVVLVVSRLDAFLISLVSLGTRHRETAVRKHLHKHGHPNARACDLPTLVRLIRRRVSFEDGGRRLDNLFRLVFRCSVWPSEDVRDIVLDLVLLRNLIVHSDGSDWSQDGAVTASYASQFRRADVLSIRKYGELAVYSVDHYRALLFVKEATLNIVEQLRHLEAALVRDMSWAESAE